MQNFESFTTTYSPAQIHQLIESLQTVQPRNAETVTPSATDFLVHRADSAERGPADDELATLAGEMPQLARFFIPNLSRFPENITTISLSVDDLVKRCYDVGYANMGSNDVPNLKTPPNAASSMTASVGVAAA
ncbi:hypothetical protein LTR37_003287 [Vermiconidia calcicola]|uniref:Uncharacterized protein n=1 Tax=Vermiconidia calcicola TaxID=1690605 RepID=A0ACC3NPT7_9PEZI|nr:hypothetical protein LTR37_003287 [Vermiconidia calcicola]